MWYNQHQVSPKCLNYAFFLFPKLSFVWRFLSPFSCSTVPERAISTCLTQLWDSAGLHRRSSGGTWSCRSAFLDSCSWCFSLCSRWGRCRSGTEVRSRLGSGTEHGKAVSEGEWGEHVRECWRKLPPESLHLTFLSERPVTWSTYSSWIMKAARLAV